MRTINLGVVDFSNSSALRISDPGYSPDSKWGATITDFRRGKYNIVVKIANCGDWGQRVAKITARHEDYPEAQPTEELRFLGVDSAEMGIIDADYFNTNHGDEKWRDKIFQKTTSKNMCGLMKGHGAVCRTGYGDGLYPLFYDKNELDEIVALEIDFDVIEE